MSQTFSKGDTVRVTDVGPWNGNARTVTHYAEPGSIGTVTAADRDHSVSVGVKFDPPAPATDDRDVVRFQYIDPSDLERVFTDAEGEALEVGDEVVVKSANPLQISDAKNAVGVVKGVSADGAGEFPVNVEYQSSVTGTTNTARFREDEVTKVPDPAFAEGDKVMLTCGCHKGQVETVTGVIPDNVTRYTLTGDLPATRDDRLEDATEATKTVSVEFDVRADFADLAQKHLDRVEWSFSAT